VLRRNPEFRFFIASGVSARHGSYTLGKGLPLIPSIVEMSGKSVSGGGLHFF
jgi:hypothetical protein